MSTMSFSVVMIWKSGSPLTIVMPSPLFRSDSSVSSSIGLSIRPRSISNRVPSRAVITRSATLLRTITPLPSLRDLSCVDAPSVLMSSPVITPPTAATSIPRSSAVVSPLALTIESVPPPPDVSVMTSPSPETLAVTATSSELLMRSSTSLIEVTSARSIVPWSPLLSVMMILPRSMPAPPFRSASSVSGPTKPFPNSKLRDVKLKGVVLRSAYPWESFWLAVTSCLTMKVNLPG